MTNRVTSHDLMQAGWHKVTRRNGAQWKPNWCHGGKTGSYTFYQAVKLYKADMAKFDSEGSLKRAQEVFNYLSR